MAKPFETRPVTYGTKKTAGFCVRCGTIASAEALFQVPDAVIVQKYCNECLPKADY